MGSLDRIVGLAQERSRRLHNARVSELERRVRALSDGDWLRLADGRRVVVHAADADAVLLSVDGSLFGFERRCVVLARLLLGAEGVAMRSI